MTTTLTETIHAPKSNEGDIAHFYCFDCNNLKVHAKTGTLVKTLCGEVVVAIYGPRPRCELCVKLAGEHQC